MSTGLMNKSNLSKTKTALSFPWDSDRLSVLHIAYVVQYSLPLLKKFYAFKGKVSLVWKEIEFISSVSVGEKPQNILYNISIISPPRQSKKCFNNT